MESIRESMLEVSLSLACNSCYFSPRYFLKQPNLQQSLSGTLGFASKIKDFASHNDLYLLSCLISLLIPDKFDPVLLLESAEAKLATSLISKLLLDLPIGCCICIFFGHCNVLLCFNFLFFCGK